MKVLLLIACSIFSVNAVSFYELFNEEWHLFKQQFNKTYKTDVEEKFRFKIYLDNKRRIEKHNRKYERGEVPFELGINNYSDMLLQEFVQQMNGLKMTSSKRKNLKKINKETFNPPENVEVPESVNWVKKGAVTPVKNQKYCGSCWAFSTTGALEGQHFIKYGYMISLSEQNLVDCSTPEGNEGCSGGQPDWAFEYVIENNGIDTEKSYPYEAKQKTCRFKKSSVGTKEVSFADVPSGNETLLKQAVALVGPISVGIDASHPSFLNYKQGIYEEPDCSSSNLDHAVLVVGYGIDEMTQRPYWLVKNSWGPEWGEDGYVKMARDADNHCGIATMASYPIV